MANRISRTFLEKRLEIVNRALGRPLEPWTKTETGVRANVGNLHIYHCLGVWAIHEMHNEGGGVSVLVSGPTLRTLDAHLDGIIATLRLLGKL